MKWNMEDIIIPIFFYLMNINLFVEFNEFINHSTDKMSDL